MNSWGRAREFIQFFNIYTNFEARPRVRSTCRAKAISASLMRRDPAEIDAILPAATLSVGPKLGPYWVAQEAAGGSDDQGPMAKPTSPGESNVEADIEIRCRSCGTETGPLRGFENMRRSDIRKAPVPYSRAIGGDSTKRRTKLERGKQDG